MPTSRTPRAARHARAGSARRSPRCRRCSACSSSARSCARTIRCSRSASARRREGRARCTACTPLHDDWLMPMARQHHARRRAAGCRRWPTSPSAIGADQGRRRAPVQGERDRRRARRSRARCCRGERKAVLLGNAAAQHPQAGDAARARAAGSASRPAPRVGYLGEAANTRRRAARRRAAGPGRPERRPDARRRRAAEGLPAAQRRAGARRRQRGRRRGGAARRPRWSSR